MADLKPGQIKNPDGIELLPLVARDTPYVGEFSVLGDAVQGWRGVNALVMVLNLTASDADEHDLLDVTVQTSFDNLTWIDIFHFAQMNGSTAAAKRIKLLNAGDHIVAGGLAEFSAATRLTAGNKREVFGPLYRAAVKIDEVHGNHSFTFSVTLYPQLGDIAWGQE